MVRANRPISVVIAIAFSTLPTGGAGQEAPKSDDFLSRLVGSWTLTGTMGQTELRQRVDSKWALQGNFVQMRFVEEGPAPQGHRPYEAIYMLGYDRQSKSYILHLFDIFGAAYSRTVGVGTRHGESVEFLFDYPNGQFSNTFTWSPRTERWEMLLRQKERTGGWRVFATKTLSRRAHT